MMDGTTKRSKTPFTEMTRTKTQKTHSPPETKAIWNPGLRLCLSTTRPLYGTAPFYSLHSYQRHTRESTHRQWSNTMLHDTQIPNTTPHSYSKEGTGMGDDYH